MTLIAGAPSAEFVSGLCYRCALDPVDVARWAWLADTHICADVAACRNGFQPSVELERTVAQIQAVQPCGVLVNGDLAWSVGRVEDYQRFRAILQPLARQVPLVVSVGNHDHRGNMLACLAGRRGPPPRRMTAMVDQPPFRFVLLDSQIDSSTVAGEIGADQLAWLDRVLESGPSLRTIVFLHHPGESASEGCLDFGDLERLADRHQCVQAVVTGHDHQFSLGRVDGVHRICLPAVGFPLDRHVKCGWVQAELSAAGLQLRVHGAVEPALHDLSWGVGATSATALGARTP